MDGESVSMMDQFIGMISKPETIAMIVGGVATAIAGSKIGGARFVMVKKVLAKTEEILHTINQALAPKE